MKKLRDNTWIQDKHNKDIYYFKEMSKTDIYGYRFKRAGAIERGSWDRKEWEEMIYYYEKRFTEDFFDKITKQRKQTMIRNLFDGDY